MTYMTDAQFDEFISLLLEDGVFSAFHEDVIQFRPKQIEIGVERYHFDGEDTPEFYINVFSSDTPKFELCLVDANASATFTLPETSPFHIKRKSENFCMTEEQRRKYVEMIAELAKMTDL